MANLIIVSTGDLLCKLNTDYSCVDSAVVIPKNFNGSLYLFLETLIILGFSFIMFYVFYLIPKRFGLIVRKEYPAFVINSFADPRATIDLI